MALRTDFSAPIDWIDVEALARQSEALTGMYALAHLPRVLADVADLADHDEHPVHWQVHSEWREPPAAVVAAWRALHGGRAAPRQLWLRLQVRAALPLVCQRCLEPYWEPVEFDRWFRFVADEATALAEDDDCEEDLLVREGPRFHLRELVEDELLLAAPLVPRHVTCPRPLPLADGDWLLAEGEAGPAPTPQEVANRQPFAALVGLKKLHKL